MQSKTSTGTAVFTVTETGAYTVEATKNGQTVSGSVNVVSSTTSYTLTLSFVSSTLNNNEWSVIKSVSDKGQGANYWSIGDRKAVTLNGTMSKLSLSNFTTYAFIIGFNHNASVEGSNRIHFQLAKTALSGGTDVCFCDSQYGPDSGWSSPGAGYFVMNASNTNSGGWKSSQMRTNICGTSLSSYSGTIIAVIPAALRAVLKSVTKYTDNTGGGSSAASNVTATTDYFSSSRSLRFSGAFPTQTATRRINKRSTPIIPPGIANQVQAQRHEYRRCLVAPFPVCEHLHQFRVCEHRRDSQHQQRALFPRLRARLLRIIRKSRLAPSMGA